MNRPEIILPALIIGLIVYFIRLPVVLKARRDLPYVLCKVWAGLQGLSVGLSIWLIITFLPSLIR